jgi:hypothetical protein
MHTALHRAFCNLEASPIHKAGALGTKLKAHP